MQPHSRHMSFSLYISALAVSDTMVVLTGKSKFLCHLLYRTDNMLGVLVCRVDVIFRGPNSQQLQIC